MTLPSGAMDSVISYNSAKQPEECLASSRNCHRCRRPPLTSWSTTRLGALEVAE